MSKNDTEDKQKVSKAESHKKQKPFNVSTQRLRGMKEIFEINLKKTSFEKLEEEVTARSFSEIMKEEASKLAGKTKKAPVLSTEDQEIKQLEDRRKELRKKEDRSQRENRVHRAEQNGEKETQRSLKKRKIILKLYFKAVEDQNIYTREDQRKRYVK